MPILGVLGIVNAVVSSIERAKMPYGFGFDTSCLVKRV